MLRRRAPQVLIGTAIIGLGATALTTPALAAETLDCSSTDLARTLSGTGPFEFFQSNDRCNGFNVVVTSPLQAVPSPPTSNGLSLKQDNTGDGVFNLDWGTTNWANQNGPQWQNTQEGIQITATGVSGVVTVNFYKNTGDSAVKLRYTITVGPGGGGDDPSGDTGSTALASGPGPHIQQFGMPESGRCDDAASADLNWAGVASGGWGESWAQWANDGAGGAVCSRTLVYDASQGTWQVG